MTSNKTQKTQLQSSVLSKSTEIRRKSTNQLSQHATMMVKNALMSTQRQKEMLQGVTMNIVISQSSCICWVFWTLFYSSCHLVATPEVRKCQISFCAVVGKDEGSSNDWFHNIPNFYADSCTEGINMLKMIFFPALMCHLKPVYWKCECFHVSKTTHSIIILHMTKHSNKSVCDRLTLFSYPLFDQLLVFARW